MKALTLAKLVLAAAGIIIFGIGIRVDNQEVRWGGIGLVVAAWLMRFAKDREGT